MQNCAWSTEVKHDTWFLTPHEVVMQHVSRGLWCPACRLEDIFMKPVWTLCVSYLDDPRYHTSQLWNTVLFLVLHDKFKKKSSCVCVVVVWRIFSLKITSESRPHSSRNRCGQGFCVVHLHFVLLARNIWCIGKKQNQTVKAVWGSPEVSDVFWQSWTQGK